MQTTLSFPAAFADTRPVSADLLARMTSETDCIRVSIRACGLKQADIARSLGVSAPYLSLIRNGQRRMPSRLIVPFCYATGSLLLQQYRDKDLIERANRGSETARMELLANELLAEAA